MSEPDAHNRREPSACYACGRLTDCDTQTNGDGVPEPGDVSVCFYCAAVGVYLSDGRIVQPTPAQLAAFMADGDVIQAIGTVLAFRGLE
jgi:hypothetical protein